MKKLNLRSKKEKGAITGLVFCFVAIIAIAGISTFNHSKTKMQKNLANAEDNLKEQTKETTTQVENQSDLTDKNGTTQPTDAPKETDDSDGTENSNVSNGSGTLNKADEDAAKTAGQVVSTASFSENDKLLRPVSGEVLIDYSMDQSVYFTTLDQYQLNPAMIISGKEGEVVFSAADGEVTTIETNAKTGTTMIVDLGGGYRAVYGQLTDVPVSVGEKVEQGAVLGYLAAPTRYYGEEGCNLYFQLMKDGKAIDPNKYLKKN